MIRLQLKLTAKINKMNQYQLSFIRINTNILKKVLKIRIAIILIRINSIILKKDVITEIIIRMNVTNFTIRISKIKKIIIGMDSNILKEKKLKITEIITIGMNSNIHKIKAIIISSKITTILRNWVYKI